MAAEFAQITYGSNILWSGGQKFNGYVLLIMALPDILGAVWTRVFLKDSRPKTRIPTRIKILIREGQYESDTKVWKTDSLVPPNVQYSSFYYDDSDRLVAFGPELFTITASPHTLIPPTPLTPTAAIAATPPEDVPSTMITTVVIGTGPTRENISGVRNGVNTAFTISRAGSVVFVIWNGLILDAGVHYTISTTSITMIAPNLPDTGDTLEAVIW